MSEACRALDFPIVSGNVSLYNESKATGGGSAILPTPAIGGIGLLADWRKSATIAFGAEGEEILLIGPAGEGHLGQSLWLREIMGREDGLPPPVSLEDERSAGEFVRMLIGAGEVTAVHDCADGGLLVALAEMALASGIGATLDVELAPTIAFGEDQGRYLATAPAGFYASLVEVPVNVRRIGTTGGRDLAYPGGSVALDTLRHAHEAFFPSLMGKELAVA
jgi:phosphoribosylformylglycinamidine synthase